jgi:hypothetical protein
MSDLPLAEGTLAGEAESMSIDIQRITGPIADFVRDWNDAQRMLVELRLNPERHVYVSGAVPDTYADFLFAISGHAPHEPSALERSRLI